MARARARDASSTELAVLEVLWDAGPSSVRTVLERLYPEGGASAFATAQKLLARLEAKGLVVRDRSGPLQTFAAALTREELLERRLRTLADELCDGSLTSLLTHLVSNRRLSAGDRRTLRQHLDHIERESRSSSDSQP